MGIPRTRQDRVNATIDFAGITIQRYVRANLPDHNSIILDVGAGWGKYRDLLPEYVMDACEIWQPYVIAEKLTDRYRRVYTMSICSLGSGILNFYDLVIFGDVLEHLSVECAQRVLKRCNAAIIAVPYLYEQGPEQDNEFERHLQDDLTPGLMMDRYPGVKHHSTEYRDGQLPFKGVWTYDASEV